MIKKKCIECLSTKVDTEKAIEKMSTPLPPAKIKLYFNNVYPPAHRMYVI